MVVVGLGSNRPHGRYGAPERVVAAAVAALAAHGLTVEAVAPVERTRPLGPAQRRFANGAVRGRWPGTAQDLLRLLKSVERSFGRRPGGRRWGPRVLDCDLLVFGGQRIATRELVVPHPGLARRAFALRPLVALWPDWRHPLLKRSARQLWGRLAKPRPTRQGMRRGS